MNDSVQQHPLRHYSSVTIRVVITLGILLLIFRNIEFEKVIGIIKQASIGYLLLAVLFQLLSTMLAGFRWYLVMHLIDFSQSVWFYIKSYFKGSFFNQGLPTSIGGDAIRVLDVASTGQRKRDSFIGVFIDRILGLTGLLLLNLIANNLAPDLLPKGMFWLINSIVLLGLCGFTLLVFLHKIQFLGQWRITAYVLRISRNLQHVLKSFKSISLQMVIGIVIHLLSMINIFFVGQSVGLDYNLLTFSVIVPPVILLTLIPVSLAGWGVREGAMIGLFTLIGADKSIVLSMSILYGIILIVASLPGLQVYLSGRHKPTIQNNE